MPDGGVAPGANAATVPLPAAVAVARPRDRRTSDILLDHCDSLTGERVSLGDVLGVMRDRAFGVLMILLAAPNLLPVAIPGISTILGTPLVILAVQMMIGCNRPWLPSWLTGRSLARRDFQMVVRRLVPPLRRVERLLQPRLALLVSPAVERAMGALCLVLAVVMVLPIPFGNSLPGLAIAVIALGLIERDGVAVLIGAVLSLVALGVAATVVLVIFKAVLFVLLGALGL